MSTVVDKAPPSAPLGLTDSNAAFFLKRDSKGVPSTVTLPGSSNLELTLFDVIATGTVKPAGPGTLILTLYGRANLDGATDDPATWLPLSSAPAEPIGGTTDLPETMFMVAGIDLMAYPGSGKIQGTFKSNVASTPVAAADLAEHPGDVTDADPLYVFAIGASFTPTGTQATRRAVPKAGDAPPLVTLNLNSLTLSA